MPPATIFHPAWHQNLSLSLTRAAKHFRPAQNVSPLPHTALKKIYCYINKLVAPFFTQPVAFQSECCGVLDGNWHSVDCVHTREFESCEPKTTDLINYTTLI
jgi:hypothetical protein